MKKLSESTVLIVDDTEENLDVLVEALADDYDVSVAMDGETALESVKMEIPDIILLDIMMPGMDGYEVCRRIKSNRNTKDIPIIFLTAITDVESKTKGFELGAVDYITKPFEILEVKARVRTHLYLKFAKHKLSEKNQILQEKTVELQAVVNELQAFSYTVSHDLKSPIRAIQAYSKIILEEHHETLDHDTNEMVSHVENICSNMICMIEKLMEYSKMTHLDICKEPVDISKMFKIAFEQCKSVCSERFINYVVLLSEYSEFEYARQGIVYGAFDYIVKPIDEEKMGKLLLKAAKCIEKKKLEKEKVKKLENELEEKVEIFYSPEDVEKIVKLFKNVDVKVAETASNLANTIEAAVDYDPLKVAYVLNRITSTLIESLKEIYPWLEKLVLTSKYSGIDFTSISRILDMKTAFLKMIEELIITISKFQFGSEMNSMIRNICRIVLERIDTEVSVKIIADQMFLNQSYLSTLYKEKTGKSLVEYITMVKMERAKILFHDSNIKNYEIASKLGYKDVEYFGKLFKKYIGITPSKYKANCTTGESG